jgi:hypothetical protein
VVTPLDRFDQAEARSRAILIRLKLTSTDVSTAGVLARDVIALFAALRAAEEREKTLRVAIEQFLYEDNRDRSILYDALAGAGTETPDA